MARITSLLTAFTAVRALSTPRWVASAAGEASARKKVVFLGTPSVAARSLELLLAASKEGRGGGFDVSTVVSQPPTRSGRKMLLNPSPVHQLAEAEGVPLLTPPNAKDDDFLATLEELEPDLCVTAAYGCFLPKRFLALPKHGTLNIHPSLLPLYRGAAPLQRCLEAGDADGGVSLLYTVLKMDAGPVLRQQVRPLAGDEQAPELLLELFEAGTELLIDALPSVWDGSSEAALEPQDEERAIAAPKVDKAEGMLWLQELSARAAHNRVRAFAGWPNTFCQIALDDGQPMRARVARTRAPADETCTPTSEISITDDKSALRFVCGDGSVLHVTELALPGKKPVGPKAFWNGLNGRVPRWLSADEVEAAKA